MALTAAQVFQADNRFYGRTALILALLALVSFVQFSLRGMTDITQMPLSTHFHAVVMTLWLALYVTQGWLAAAGNMRWHRPLGWFGAALAVAIVIEGFNIGVTTLSLGRVPPFFDQPYFLALTICQSIAFGGLVAAAIINRKRTDWHRRFMLIVMIVLLEPVLGRLLPLPFMGTWFVWVQLAIQLGVLWLAMLHDKRTRGAIHPALAWGLGALIINFAAIQILSRIGAFREYAMGLLPAVA